MHTQQITNGSVKELWKISFPLMISFLSLFTMVFVDRIFLSFYSTDALKAATSSGTFSWSLILGFSTLAGLCEVFVAQYNGAKQYKMLGEPVWQMIWLSLLSTLFFLPLGLFAAKSLYGEFSKTNFDYQYFRYTMFLSPLPVLLAALTGFFVGQGKTSIIKWLGLIGNIVNAILDPILIFGIKGVIPSLGILGTSIATVAGIGVQVIILICLFFQKKNQEEYGTNKWRFKLDTFIACLKVGMPPAVFVFVELFGWSIFYRMMAQISGEHILVSSICQSILLLFIFFGLGIEKGAAVVAGNLIGASKQELIPKILQSGIKLLIVFSSVVFFFLVIYPDFLINLFLNNPNSFESGVSTSMLSSEQLKSLIYDIKVGLCFIFVYMVIEDVRWLINGILTAAGDTMFLMIAGAGSVWLFLLLPTYLFVYLPKADIKVAFFIWVVYSFISVALFYMRFKQGKWKERSLVIDEATQPE